MNINERITIDTDELFRILDEKLDKLQQLRYNTRYRELLGDSVVDKLNVWEKNIRNQKDVPLTVVVCGEFKRGKSSLINALLGEDVATTNITTETITVNRISYGEHSNELVLAGGKRLVLSDEELKCEKLEKILAEISKTDKITVLELKRPIEILKELTIIDTPGLGDSLKDFTQEVDFALKQADAVIYTFSVGYPMSMNEQYFIKTAIKPQKYTDLFLVANSCDIVEEEADLERMKKVIVERIKNILPGEEPLMLSALDERCIQLEKKRPNEELAEVLAGNFEKFRESLNELLETKRHMVIPDRIQRMMNSMMGDVKVDIDAINEGLSASLEELEKKKKEIAETKMQYAEEQANIINEIDDKLEVYKSNAGKWMTEFVMCMEQDAANLKTFKIDDIKKFYPVFCIDSLQNAIDKCNEYFNDAVFREIEAVSAEIAKNLSIKPNVNTTAFSFSINTHKWTKGDNLQFVNQRFFGSLLLEFVAGTMREKELEKDAPDVIKNIREQFPGLRTSVIPAINKSYSEIAENAKKLLLEFFAEKKEELDAGVDKATEIARMDEARKLEVKAAVDEISSILQNITDEIAE